MATAVKPIERAVPLYRLTVNQYETMIAAGVFPGGAHVELLGGLLVEKMTKDDPHDTIVVVLAELLRRVVPPGWFVREEKSLKLGRYWRPEPDLTVVRGRPMEYFHRTPQAADLALATEVVNTSYAKDRGVMWRRYAASRIPIYWIVNYPKRQIEVHGDPAGRGKSARYESCQIYGEDAEVPVMIDGREVGRIAVRDLLP